MQYGSDRTAWPEILVHPGGDVLAVTRRAEAGPLRSGPATAVPPPQPLQGMSLGVFAMLRPSHGRHPHHRHRVRHQLVARALALARRHHRLRRGARAGRGLRADGVLPRDTSATRTSMPPKARDAWLRLVRAHARRAVHRDLLHRAGRRGLQGLRPQLRRGAALAGDDAGREARRVAAHHDARPPPGASTAMPSARARAPASTIRRPHRASPARPAATTAAGRGPRHAPAARCATRAPHRAAGWPVFVGQVAVLGLHHRRHRAGRRATSAADLAALAVGAAAYITVFIGLMGVVLAIGPIVGQLYGASGCTRPAQQLHQAVWLALGLSVLGSTLLAVPAAVPRAVAAPRPRSPTRCAATCWRWRFSLPAALLFTAYRGFNTAVSRPKAVMALQLGGLALKVPLSARWCSACRALGTAGAGRRPAAASRPRSRCGRRCSPPAWCCGATRSTRRFALRGRGLRRPRPAQPAALLRLGVPMGAGDPDRGDRLHLHGVLHRAPRRHAGGRAPDRRQPGVADVHDAAGAGQRDQHAGGAAHRRRRIARRAPRSAGTACSSASRWPRWLGARGVPRRARRSSRAVHRTTRRSSPRRCRWWPGSRCSTSATRRRRSPRSCCAPTASRRCRW